MNDLKNKYFLFFIFAAFLLLITWFLIDSPKTIRVLTIFLFVLSQFLYNIKIISRDEYYFNRFVNWIYLILFFLFAITYLLLSVKEIEIALFAFLSVPFILFIGLSILSLFSLWESKNILKIIILYIFLVFSVIILFGYSFAFINVFGGGNEIKWASENKVVEDIWDSIYFSAQIFYSRNSGEIVPLGLSRLLIVIELVFSAIIHIIVLGSIVSRLREK